MKDFKNGNFLIIDDYAAVRLMVIKDLNLIGIDGEIFEAQSGVDAISKLKYLQSKTQIDFIISDWEMENGNGIDVLKYIRSTEAYQNIPFLMLSSIGKKEIVVNAIKAGVTDYLLKPWEKEQLEKKIESCWKKKYKI